MPIALLIVLILCGWPDVLGAQQPPAEPFVVRDVCPYECCRLGAWTSRGAVAVRSAPRPDASVVFTLAAGDGVTALRGDLWASTLGRAVLRRPLGPKFRDSTLRPAVGDTVYVVALSGEAGWYVWHAGVLHKDVDSFWSDRLPLHAGASAVLLSSPDGSWWVEVQRGDDTRGWVPVSQISPYGLFGVEPGFEGTSTCS